MDIDTYLVKKGITRAQWAAAELAAATAISGHDAAIIALLAAEGVTSVNPNILSNLNAVVLSGGATAYTLTFSPAHSALAANHRMSVRMNVACVANPTLNTDGRGALNFVKPDGTTNIGAGEMALGYIYDIQLNAAKTKWVVYNFQAAAGGPAAHHITTGNYTALAGEIVEINGAHAVTLPTAPAPVAGDEVRVYMGALANGTVKDGASTIGHYYDVGDGGTYTYNGATWNVSQEAITVRGRLTKTADLSISAGSYVDGYASSYLEQIDKGGWFNTGTDNLTAVFACEIDIFGTIVANKGAYNLNLVPRVNGTQYLDVSEAGSGSNPNGMEFFSYHIELAANDVVDFYVENAHSSNSYTMKGNAADDESRVSWNVTRRIRT